MPGENIQDWSITATDNGNADSSINWAEGQPRASVNNSARGMMAALAKDRNLQNGSIVTGGTANAQTFTSGVTYTSVPAGLRVLLKIGPGLTNTTSATLNMDGIGAVTIYTQYSQTLSAGMLRGDAYAEFLYNGSSWILLNVPPSEALTTIRTFTATGVGTNTYPTSVLSTKVLVMCKGAGGGGATSTTANAGGGGGEGATAWKLTTSAALSGQTIIIGDGGAGAAAATGNGMTGGASSAGYGTIVFASGGGGGNAGQFGGAGGLGGQGMTGDWIDPGAAGAAGGDIFGSAIAMHAAGGGSGAGNSAGAAGAANSGGGGSNGTGGTAAGNGGSGIVVCYEYGAI